MKWLLAFFLLLNSPISIFLIKFITTENKNREISMVNALSNLKSPVDFPPLSMNKIQPNTIIIEFATKNNFFVYLISSLY